MDHIVLNVEDDEKMISFYSKVLLMPPNGWTNTVRGMFHSRLCDSMRTQSSTCFRKKCGGKALGREAVTRI